MGSVSVTMEEDSERTERDVRLSKMGFLTALAIGIHNFPEGLATFVATLADPTIGVALAVAWQGTHTVLLPSS